MDAAFKLKTQNERAKVEDLFEFEGKEIEAQHDKFNLNLLHFDFSCIFSA